MVFVASDLADFPDGKTTLRYMAARSLLDGLPSTKHAPADRGYDAYFHHLGQDPLILLLRHDSASAWRPINE